MWNLHCVTCKSSDTEPSIMVSFEGGKYMFNCGEGTTRALIQSGRGFKKIRSIYATRIDTECLGGLPGQIMTIADARSPKLNLYGPRGFKYYLASTRLFLMRTSMSVEVTEADCLQPGIASLLSKDDNLSVYAVPLVSCEASAESPLKRKRNVEDVDGKPSSKRLVLENAVLDADSSDSNTRSTSRSDLEAEGWVDSIVRNMFKPATHADEVQSKQIEKGAASSEHAIFSKRYFEPLPRLTYPRSVTCFIGIANPPLGKFDARKAQELGLKPGPDRGKLARGEAVTLPNGVVITPDMCVSAPESPTAFVIIDCPSLDYLPSVINSQHLRALPGPHAAQLHVIIHILGPGVLEDERYRQWMKLFGSDIHHIISSPRYSPDPITFTSAAFATLKLSRLDSDMFPVPRFSLESEAKLESESDLPKNSIPLRSNLLVSMRPSRPPEQDPLWPLSADQFHPAIFNGTEGPPSNSIINPKIAEAFESARLAMKEHQLSRSDTYEYGDDVVVISLGTGSALPSKYRTVSATLVMIPGSGNILFDAGEGTWGQLVRYFGTNAAEPNNVWSVLRDLRCIFISHIHGDHMIGLRKILVKRRLVEDQMEEPLYLVCNHGVHVSLLDYNNIEDMGLDRSVGSPRATGILTVNTKLFSERSNETSPRPNAMVRGISSQLGLKSFSIVEVEHGTLCHAAVLWHREGWGLAYSGDTRPCDRLAEAAKDVTLLIHEATFGDHEIDLAQKRMHSTFTEALEVGKKANAKSILLTHFSARYPKVTQKQVSLAVAARNCAMAVDGVRIRLGDIWRMNHYFGAIERSYLDPSTAEEEEDIIT